MIGSNQKPGNAEGNLCACGTRRCKQEQAQAQGEEIGVADRRPLFHAPPAPHNAFLGRPNMPLGRGTPSDKKGGEDIEKHAGPTSETVPSRALDSWHSR